MLWVLLWPLGGRQAMHKMAARANRLAVLLQRPVETLTVAEAKELAGLQNTETYDEEVFTAEHAAFKAAHNAMFVDLSRYAAGDGACFYLDGPQGGTTAALLGAGFERRKLFTANWHPETAVALREHLPAENVAAGRAEHALRAGLFATQPFAGLYIDGCGGSPEPIVGCIDALFDAERAVINPRRIAFGFTLTVAERTGRSLADREVDVQRALAAACRKNSYTMTHVADEPGRYGADAATGKREGGTLTSWHMCEKLEFSDSPPPPSVLGG